MESNAEAQSKKSKRWEKMRSYLWLAIGVAFFVVQIALCDLRKGDVAPSFTLPTVDGRILSVTTVKKNAKATFKVTLTKPGQSNKKMAQDLKFKLLLIDFSTTWCPGCQVVREVLRNLWKNYSKKGLLIIAIYDDDPNATRTYAKTYKLPYIVAIDNKSEVTTNYKVEAYPTIYLVDTSGKVVSVPDDYSEAALSKVVESFGIK